MIARRDLWSTPVWEYQTGFDTHFNKELLREISMLQPSNNIWENAGTHIDKVRTTFLEFVEQAAGVYFKEENLFSRNYPFNPHMSRGWVSRQNPGESLPLHDHVGTLLACVYYVNTPQNAGDLLLVDPRGGVNWGSLTENNITGIKYKRVTPEAGKMVMFPAYVLHYVETNRSNQPRISLSTNIYNPPKTK